MIPRTNIDRTQALAARRALTVAATPVRLARVPGSLIPAALVLGLLGSGAIGSAGGTLRSVRFLPQWQPQAQFAGYYVAVEKGFYRSRGVDLVIQRGGPDRPPCDELLKDSTDFATMFLASAIEKRSQGVPLVNIAQIVQRSSLLLVARASSGIRTPKDLDGRKISVWPEFRTQPDALFRKFGVQPVVLTQGATINLFLRGAVDAASAMWYNEYHLLLNGGMEPEELTVFFYDAYGLNFPEDGIYCLQPTYQKDPQLCEMIAAGSLQGWRYAFAHEEEALDIVMRYVTEAHIGTNRVHQRWMLKRMKDIIVPGDGRRVLGTLAREDYSTTATELQNSGSIDTIPSFESFRGSTE